jgi:hypothetical protein
VSGYRNHHRYSIYSTGHSAVVYTVARTPRDELDDHALQIRSYPDCMVAKIIVVTTSIKVGLVLIFGSSQTTTAGTIRLV